MDLREAPSFVWALVILCIFGAVGLLVLTELNNSGGWDVENSTEAAIIGNSTLAVSNFSNQLPTVGIIMGVMLIIGAVLLMAVYFMRQQENA